jgi:hypothetical protein
MKRPILLALVSVTASLPAAAQEDWSVWETDWKAEAGLVLSPGRMSKRSTVWDLASIPIVSWITDWCWALPFSWTRNRIILPVRDSPVSLQIRRLVCLR